MHLKRLRKTWPSECLGCRKVEGDQCRRSNCLEALSGEKVGLASKEFKAAFCLLSQKMGLLGSLYPELSTK